MKGSFRTLLIVGAILLVAFLGIRWYINLRNELVTLDEGVKTAWSQVENQLQRRMDLIPNLVETVKGYAAHEQEVLTEVTKARASVGGAQSPAEKIEANNQLTGALARLLIVVERYPDLKANTNFMALQDELSGTENRLAVERRRYNEAAQVYNTTIRKIPYSFFAGGFERAPLFEAAEGAKQAPQVKF
jgi:LemA protein